MSGKLAYSIFRPENGADAVLFVVHGMQEHRQRYKGFAEYLCSRKIAVITYDLPGHGETSGTDDRGWFGEEDGWKNLTDSAVEIAQLARREFPSVPVIMFGHSMGTMIGRTFLQKHDALVDAVILSGAPNYQSAAGIGKAVARLVRASKGARGHSALLDKLATGSFNKSVKDPRTPLDWLSYNTENVDRYIEDEACGFPFTVQGYYDLFCGMIAMHDVSAYRCLKPDMPILFFAGEDDPCIGKEKGLRSSMDTLAQAGYRNIDMKLYPGMRHETLQEENAEQVYADTAEWILAHI